MKCYVYIDFSLIDNGRAIGFAVGRIEIDGRPVVGEKLKIGGACADEGGRKSEFLVTRVVAADRSVAGNEDLSWLVTCDDNFFPSSSEIMKVVACLEESGFVYDPFQSE